MKTIKNRLTSEVESLEKLEPIFVTLKRLRQLAIDKGIQGFRGFLIDFINIPKELASCLDLAGKSKLFSVIVDDVDTAK